MDDTTNTEYSTYLFALIAPDGTRLGTHVEPWGEDRGHEWDSGTAIDYAMEAAEASGLDVAGYLIILDDGLALNADGDEVPWTVDDDRAAGAIVLNVDADTLRAARYYEERIRPGDLAAGVPDDAIDFLRRKYIGDALDSPEALIELRELYP